MTIFQLCHIFRFLPFKVSVQRFQQTCWDIPAATAIPLVHRFLLFRDLVIVIAAITAIGSSTVGNDDDRVVAKLV